ncbi:cytochrome c-type biogenesis protein CcmH [Erythrobacter litoralis]|jgi:cytochrome c-type biogenesis protein CcmH|uniref:tetratricopeptide repeat protein n=1 Tax=Erythrobacter TaxID=1041 RepID=UPI000555B6CC|nr:tetratricopeptide repeat protein [Erythrobacter litoralis]AOL23897.1 cytochrome c-type biogenesis protein CcmH [Erythrobacter litoralis]MEE4337362.1 tetratricopeptide repeat protein [Erythrobacter sp.]
MIGGWLGVLALALAAFALAAFLLRLPREGFAVFGAALLFGLAGYAMQGSPGQPAAPKERVIAESEGGEAMVEARRALFDPVRPKPDYLTISDGFARNGKFEEAAGLLRRGLAENPSHLEGWLALGMALVGHADGQVTPAAAYAYGKAREIDPDSPAPDYFLGFSYLQSGQIRAARETWARLVESSPEDAPWVPELTARIAELDRMIANAPMLR